MKKKYFVLFAFILCALSGYSQVLKDSTNNKKFGISFSGFVRVEAAFDTRQVNGYREQLIALYPSNISLDKNGNDVNARPNFNQYAMSSRLTGIATGANAFGAKSMACLEGDFTGPSNVQNNVFRLRHAYIKLNWIKSELLIGQYWHPLTAPEIMPSMISINTGTPYHPYSRHPQIRYSRVFGKLNLVAVALSERDNTSTGPLGNTYEYLSSSIIPNMHLQIHFKNEENFLLGVAADYRKLRLRFITDSLLKTNESIDCYAFSAFAKFKSEKFTIKLQSVFGQNLYEHLMMGGIGVQKIDTATGKSTYTTLDQFTCWADICSNNKNKLNTGLFLGYSKNLGSVHNIWGDSYGRGNDIAYTFRVSPRITWTTGNLKIASEFEYTAAAYGIPNWLGDVNDTKELNNFRLLIAAFYTF